MLFSDLHMWVVACTCYLPYLLKYAHTLIPGLKRKKTSELNSLVYLVYYRTARAVGENPISEDEVRDIYHTQKQYALNLRRKIYAH